MGKQRLGADQLAFIFRKVGVTEWGLRTECESTPCTVRRRDFRRSPRPLSPTKDGADKPSRFANLGRVFARLVVAVRFALWCPATSAVHATHGPAPNGG